MKIIPRDTHHVEHLFQKKMLEKLWEPVTMAGVTSKNRISLAPIGWGHFEFGVPGTDDATSNHIQFYEALAKGGTGIIVVGEATVTPPVAKPGLREPWAWICSDETLPDWTKLIDACHKWGATVFPQLSTHVPWFRKLSPKRIRDKVVVPSWKEAGVTIEALEVEKRNYVAGALRAKKAGADGVQIHGTREHLIHILLSELLNPGVPGYCEDFKARVRWGTECIREIKESCGKDFAVIQRLSGAEYIPGGYDVEYAKLVAKEYVDAGVDSIDVAQAGSLTQVPQQMMVAPTGSYAYLARAVKDYLTSLGPPYSEVVIWNTCRIQNPWIAASMLRNGDCDVVSLCKQLIADHDWGNKIREGRIDDIIPCIGCGRCHGRQTPESTHLGSLYYVTTGGPCTINPEGLFHILTPKPITKAKKVKKVLVAGGGAAGMEAARALALRGHKVTLCEKEEELGRMLNIQSLAPFRLDMDLPRKYLSTQVRKLGVDVRCNQEVTAALVKKEKPDCVIVATGCRPVLPEIPGINRPNVVFAEDVLLENVDVGKRVVVIDADAGHDVGSIGSFAAQFAARSACVRDDVAMFLGRWSPYTPEKVVAMSNTPVGRQVTIVTKRGRIADVERHHWTTMEDLRKMGVKVIVGCDEYKEINDKGLVIVSGRREMLLEADTIITASYESNNELYKELEGKVPELHLIGDAKAIRLELVAAIHEAYRIALTI